MQCRLDRSIFREAPQIWIVQKKPWQFASLEMALAPKASVALSVAL